MLFSILLSLYVFKYYFNDVVKNDPFFNKNIMVPYLNGKNIEGYDERYPLTSNINTTKLNAINEYLYKLGILQKLNNPLISDIDKIAILDQLDMYSDFTMNVRGFIDNDWFAGWLIESNKE